MDALPSVNNIQSLYLNTHGADVWFRINDDRVPGHKLILGAMCPYYKTMFYGLLPENNVVNMTEAVESVESFKEFLKFMYLRQPDLTMDNIEDVISLAKQSLSNEFLSSCESFLRTSLTDNPDTIFRIYRLAILYDLDDLKMYCSEYVCVFAVHVLKSSGFTEFPFEYLRTVLQCDALACEETEVFNAIMRWAKTACKENSLDPSNGRNLRDQLKDALHQIRFTSMTKLEAAECIRSYPGLLTAEELEEIICMVAQDDQFQPKQFNWTPRYFDLNWNNGRYIQLSLFDRYDDYKSFSPIRSTTTTLSCNRWVILNSLFYQLHLFCEIGRIRVVISERKGENEIVRFNKTLLPQHKKQHSRVIEMEIVMHKPIVFRPKYNYEITIEFMSDDVDACNHIVDARKKRVDHDIVFDFKGSNVISGLSICRFDNKNYLQKVVHNPKFWMIVMGVGVGIAGAAYFKIDHAVPEAPIATTDVKPQHVVQQSFFTSIFNRF